MVKRITARGITTGEILESAELQVKEELANRRERILAVLARAADDEHFLARLADDPTEALKYYVLTDEEKAALASGDIARIEGWLGKLDQRHATWLWCRLCQEKW
jgi:hypothetical protein